MALFARVTASLPASLARPASIGSTNFLRKVAGLMWLGRRRLVIS